MKPQQLLTFPPRGAAAVEGVTPAGGATSLPARLARLRGALPAEAPGARGLERMARNPGCTRLRALVIAGITPATAATAIYGESEAGEGQSPFAIANGNRFEARLYEHNATRLLALYHESGRLAAHENRVAVIPALCPGTGPAELARRRQESERLLRARLAGDPAAPNLIVQPRLQVDLLGMPHAIEPDFLVAGDAEPFYRPGEVKSYPDRAGKTDPIDIRGACRQAAVAIAGLRQALVRLGVAAPARLVPAVGDLVLRVPGSMAATLRPMQLAGEVDSLERVLQAAPGSLDQLEQLVAAQGAGAALDDPAVLDAIPNAYRSGCREFCALAVRCKRAAAAAGAPVLLGSRAAEELAAAGSLPRALALLNGSGPPPRTAQEQALARRLRAIDHELKQAV